MVAGPVACRIGACVTHPLFARRHDNYGGPRTPQKASRWQYGLTAGELGAIGSQTTIGAVLPLLLVRYAASNFWVGFSIGGEGLFTVAVPFWIGLASDRMPWGLAKRFGRRMLILLIAGPAMAIAAVAAPFAHTYWLMTAAAFAFFFALHVYLTPLRTLMLDSVPDERRARVQGVGGVLRACGLAYGLVAGGLLFSVSHTLPFLIAGALILLTTAVTWLAERKAGGDRSRDAGGDAGLREFGLRLERHPAAIWFLIANACWNGALDAIRPYLFAFGRVVLGLSVAQTSLTLAVLVSGIAIGSVIFGWIGDTVARGKLLGIGSGLLAVALIGGTFVRGVPWAAAALGAGGIGVASYVTLSYPFFAELVGAERLGEYTGLWMFSVGFGRILAPMLTGAIIDLAMPFMPKTKGYPLMWTTAGVLTIIGWVLLIYTLRVGAKHGFVDRPAEERAREGRG